MNQVNMNFTCRQTSKHERRKQRHTEDSGIDLTLSNTIDLTTEESKIWWPWASYEEWKQANHFDLGSQDDSEGVIRDSSPSEAVMRDNGPSEALVSTTLEPRTSPETLADQAVTHRVQHKRSRKTNEKKSEQRLQEKLRRQEEKLRRQEEKKRKEREEKQERRRREREMKKRRRQNERKKRRGRVDHVMVDDEELERAVWNLLQSRWGDYLTNEGNNECTNEIEHCRPKCLVFHRTGSYICTCPVTHELNIDNHSCRRK
ncbi:hypothetical protein M8J75_013741 [Diaphorina citri]|nr:hypothetical protein M8J75_013741 [Diaphorina citri]